MQKPLGFSHQWLHQRGYRLTPQRYLIFQVIQEARGHLTLEQIIEQVRVHNPCVNLSTIYRTLDLLKALDLVHETRLPGEPVTYETWKGHTHHHLLCRGCRAIIHPDPTLLSQLQQNVQEQYHFEQVTLEVVVTGYCDICKQAAHTKSG